MEELCLNAEISNVPVVTEFVENILTNSGCPMKAIIQINVAIDEIFSNIANYAYNPEAGSATVKVEVDEKIPQVIITFIDNGNPFDPLKKEDPDVTLSAEEREIGGLGIFIVKETMDAIEYEYKEGQNILTIKKNFYE